MKKKGENISNIMSDVKFSDWGKWEKDFAELRKKDPISYLGSWRVNFKRGGLAKAQFVSNNLNILQKEIITLKKNLKKQRIKFLAQSFLAAFLTILFLWGFLKILSTKTFDYKSITPDPKSISSNFNQDASLFWPQSSQRKYFIIFSDARMLRPFGGFFANYALADFSSATTSVKVEDFGSLYNLDGSFSQQFIPPLGLSSTTNIWSIHDSDFVSNFEDVSDLINFILKKNKYSKIDGLYLISTNFIEDFVKKYGAFPIQGERSINAENIYSVFGNVWEKEFGASLVRPNSLLPEAVDGLFKALKNLSNEESGNFLISQIAQKNLWVSLQNYPADSGAQNIKNFYSAEQSDQGISILDLSHTIFQTPPGLSVRADFKKDGDDILEDLTIIPSNVLNANSFLYINLELPSGFFLESSYPQYAQNPQFAFSGNLEDYFTESSSGLKFFHDQTLGADVFMNKGKIGFGKLLQGQNLRGPIKFSLRWKGAAMSLPINFNLSILPSFNYDFSLKGQGLQAEFSPAEILWNNQKYTTKDINIHLSNINLPE